MKSKGMKRTISAFALALVLSLTGVIVSAQQGTQEQDGGSGQGRSWHRKGGKGHRGMKRGGFGGHFKNLNLTDAQKAQIEQITTRFRESAKARRQQARTNRGEGRMEAFNGGTFNESAVRAAAQARANAQVEAQVERARMMFEIYNVLTAEQKAQLAAERQQLQQKRQERRALRQANPATIQ
jgi:Spy/CpxP family protein refolding chaperone